MNTKAIYAVGGGIAAAAIAIFFILGQGNLSIPNAQLIQNPTNTPTAPNNQTNVDLQISLKSIIVNKTSDKNAKVETIFNAFNPNRSTVTLETVSYAVYVGQYKMASADIGRSPEGFIGGQEDTFPVIAGSTVTLRDTQVAVRNNLTASSWDSMVQGTAHYRVEGAYSYRLTGANFQTAYFEKQFNLTFQ